MPNNFVYLFKGRGGTLNYSSWSVLLARWRRRRELWGKNPKSFLINFLRGLFEWGRRKCWKICLKTKEKLVFFEWDCSPYDFASHQTSAPHRTSSASVTLTKKISRFQFFLFIFVSEESLKEIFHWKLKTYVRSYLMMQKCHQIALMFYL